MGEANYFLDIETSTSIREPYRHSSIRPPVGSMLGGDAAMTAACGVLRLSMVSPSCAPPGKTASGRAP